MFDRLATSLNIAFKWLPMFDQPFSFNILLQQTKLPQAVKNNQSEAESVTSLHNLSIIYRKGYVGSLCLACVAGAR